MDALRTGADQQGGGVSPAHLLQIRTKNMTQDKVNQMVAAMKEEGKAPAEITKTLFNTKGVKMAQMRKAGAL